MSSILISQTTTAKISRAPLVDLGIPSWTTCPASKTSPIWQKESFQIKKQVLSTYSPKSWKTDCWHKVCWVMSVAIQLNLHFTTISTVASTLTRLVVIQITTKTSSRWSKSKVWNTNATPRNQLMVILIPSSGLELIIRSLMQRLCIFNTDSLHLPTAGSLGKKSLPWSNSSTKATMCGLETREATNTAGVTTTMIHTGEIIGSSPFLIWRTTW